MPKEHVVEDKKVSKNGIDAKQAQAILQKDMQDKMKGCQKEIEAVLTKYNMDMDLSMIISRGAIIPRFGLVPKQGG